MCLTLGMVILPLFFLTCKSFSSIVLKAYSHSWHVNVLIVCSFFLVSSKILIVSLFLLSPANSSRSFTFIFSLSLSSWTTPSYFLPAEYSILSASRDFFVWLCSFLSFSISLRPFTSPSLDLFFILWALCLWSSDAFLVMKVYLHSGQLYDT